MFRNRLHLGTIFGIIFLAPSLFFLALIILEFDYGYIIEDLVVYLSAFLLFITCSIGFYYRKKWALYLASLIILIVCLIATYFMFFVSFIYIDYDSLGFLVMFYMLFFGIISLLNNEQVLNQFGKKESDNDLDNILDTEEY